MRNYLLSNEYALMDDLFNQFFKDVNEERFTTLKADVIKTQNGFEVEVEIPGFKKEEINVSYEKDLLTVWAERAKVRIIKHEEGADASAVVFDALTSVKSKKTDVLIVDTAGRLHVKSNLMEELKKIDRVIKREYPEANYYKLIALDATTGQNAYNQVDAFNKEVGIDGIVLTKLDGTAKGGFIISLSYELEVPVVYVGTGEKLEDIEEFDAKEFVEALF